MAYISFGQIIYAVLIFFIYWYFFSLQCEIYGEIGEVINGEKEGLYQETTIFKSVGKLYSLGHIDEQRAFKGKFSNSGYHYQSLWS